MPRPSPDPEGQAPSSPQVAGRALPPPTVRACRALAARLSPSWELRGTASSPGLLLPHPGGSLSLLLTLRPKAQAWWWRSVGLHNNTPGGRSRGCFGRRCWPWSLQGSQGSPSCPSGMLFSAYTAVVSDARAHGLEQGGNLYRVFPGQR